MEAIDYNQTHLSKINTFLERYQNDSLVQLINSEFNKSDHKKIQVKGISGSLDSVIIAALYTIAPQSHIFVLHDKEEAAYFRHDLQSLLPEKNVLFFPTSYKKPYQFIETENANILQRAEVLNVISQKNLSGELIVTYPEALTEKVISQKALIENTFTAKVGEKLDIPFLEEFLIEYGFEKADFVYEAGQFAVRGGIIDVFSYANEYPYRLELFDNEIESIRSFDPFTQLSVEPLPTIAIIPNVQTRMYHEVRESFFKFSSLKTNIWLKDIELTADIIQNYFERASSDFDNILLACDNTQVINNPEDLFESKESFLHLLSQFTQVEFGNRFVLKNANKIVLESKPQPSFNKDFSLLLEDLEQNQIRGFHNVITSNLPRQFNRLRTIFDELKPGHEFSELPIALRGGFIDFTTNLVCYTDHQIFERFHRYQTKKQFSKSKAITIKELKTLTIGDYVTHVDYGVARFGGMKKIQVNDKEQEAVRLIYKDNDLLYVSIHSLHKISRYSGKEGNVPKVSKLGSPEWDNKKKKAKRKIKDIAKDLIKLYAKRRAAPGYQYPLDDYLQAELESSFIYEDTPDQAKAANLVKEDMQEPHPMDRLVCGDVGFGKTEVAIRAAFKAVNDSKQVAVLVPTTILAMQHYKTFKERLEKLPCKVGYINRFKTTKEIKQTLKETAEGKIDILIGTHRITSKDVVFKDLGLLVIDEEQKFGVKTKEKLKEMKVNVDTLTLTATPIPRTLQFSLMGARDLSIIQTPPPNRQPVTTELHVYKDEIVRDAIMFELQRGGQVFFVHNRISDIEGMANSILSLVPDAKIAYAHGQMDGKKLEKIMLKFIDGEYDLLISTNIIESGLDIPNANTIIINRAHMFGLSDLHQMRGRVGRSNRKAYCYLLTPAMAGLSSDARKRLSTLEQFSDLGDGFKVAMRDLDIRGAGDLLGGEQSGFISDLGFDMYNQILEEAIQELKENEYKELFKNEIEVGNLKTDCVIETDLEILIPENYVTNISERLSLYIAADEIKDEKELEIFKSDLIDRFGPLPVGVSDLLKSVRLRWKAESLGIEKLILKNGSLKAYLPESEKVSYYQSAIFGNILKFVNKNPRKCKVKEAKNRLIMTIEDVINVELASDRFDQILK